MTVEVSGGFLRRVVNFLNPRVHEPTEEEWVREFQDFFEVTPTDPSAKDIVNLQLEVLRRSSQVQQLLIPGMEFSQYQIEKSYFARAEFVAAHFGITLQPG